MKKRELIINLISLAFLSIFIALFSTLVHYDFFRSIDYQSMLGLQIRANNIIDTVFSVFTLIASSEVTLLIVSIIVIYYYLRFKKIAFAVFLYILIYPLELLGKLLIYHPKPPIFLNRNVFDFHLPISFYISTNYSYPSGHMARSAFLISLLFFLINKKSAIKFKRSVIITLLFIYLTIMFLSRVYLGEHWLSDVVGGTLLGMLVAMLAKLLW